MITVIKTPRFFELEFQYNQRVVKDIKAVPGHRWNPVKKLWTIPLESESSVNWILKKYGVESSGNDSPEEFNTIPDLPDLDIEVPIKRTLFPFQSKGVAQALKMKRLIIGDQPGLGKTTQAIATIVAANAFPCLIICPSSLKYNWQKEWEEVAGIKPIILNEKVKNTWQQYYHVGICKVFITNYESLKKYFVQGIEKPDGIPLRLNHIKFKDSINLFKSVAIDELHKCKDGSTMQAKFVMGICKKKEYVLGLTGTPVVNKPKDLLSQLHIIDRLVEMGGYKYFMTRYCGGNGSGATNLRELNYKLCTTCFYQREKKEVLKELPDKIRQIVLCDITTQKEYDAALLDLATYLSDYRSKSDEEITKSMRGEIMVKIGVCKNISARGKLNEVIEHIDEVTESGEKIVVFIHQKEIAAALKRHYPKAVSITGDDNMEERNNAVYQFQNIKNTQIIICSIKAAGVGITLTASSRVAFVELPWTAADCDQCEDRTHRIGQHNSVQCTYFLGAGTIDEDIYKIIEGKRSIAGQVTGTVDNTQKEIIDRISNSLLNKENKA